MIKGTSEYLSDIVKTHKCPEHDVALVVAWHAGENSFVIRCGAGHFPEEVKRQPSLTDLYKQGVELPEPIQSNVKKAIAKGLPKQPKYAGALTLGGIEARDLATGEVLSEALVKAIVQYAQRYGLDPYRGHVCLMYGKPYITIDGYLYHAYKTKRQFSLESRPMTTEELQQYKLGATDHAWLSKVNFTAEHTYFSGVGIVTYEEMTAKSPRDNVKLRSPVVAAHPWQLAQKRAEWQALRRGFPIGENEQQKEE